MPRIPIKLGNRRIALLCMDSFVHLFCVLIVYNLIIRNIFVLSRTFYKISLVYKISFIFKTLSYSGKAWRKLPLLLYFSKGSIWAISLICSTILSVSYLKIERSAFTLWSPEN